jgi:hypothetical protein
MERENGLTTGQIIAIFIGATIAILISILVIAFFVSLANSMSQAFTMEEKKMIYWAILVIIFAAGILWIILRLHCQYINNLRTMNAIANDTIRTALPAYTEGMYGMPPGGAKVSFNITPNAAQLNNPGLAGYSSSFQPAPSLNPASMIDPRALRELTNGRVAGGYQVPTEEEIKWMSKPYEEIGNGD